MEAVSNFALENALDGVPRVGLRGEDALDGHELVSAQIDRLGSTTMTSHSLSAVRVRLFCAVLLPVMTPFERGPGVQCGEHGDYWRAGLVTRDGAV